MATEVETLLPSNSLLKPEELEHQAGEDGGFVGKEQSLKRAKDESNSQAKENLEQESEDDACKTEFTEAPPPKVNPWTKKMSGVNGQALHEHSGPTKVVKAGNTRARRGGKVSGLL
ncbi:la-related protein 1-like [Pimephales promelas]|uniref:la-related protein 1-like n=1 Tax=Pimephales promelas TaxID=90988 RepID=UPI0019558660|nr:la-related protein 1-like [Pimephales promelas]KAG1930794.1 la-related protein [Pimephales promelas]